MDNNDVVDEQRTVSDRADAEVTEPIAIEKVELDAAVDLAKNKVNVC